MLLIRLFRARGVASAEVLVWATQGELDHRVRGMTGKVILVTVAGYAGRPVRKASADAGSTRVVDDDLSRDTLTVA